MTKLILSEDKNIEAFFDEFIGVRNEFIHSIGLCSLDGLEIETDIEE